MTERDAAIVLANKVLDTPYRDPDDDLSMISRQFLRAIERQGWLRIETARDFGAEDGRTVLVWASPYDELPGFQSTASYHPDAGWCVDELREVTHWQPLPDPPTT